MARGHGRRGGLGRWAALAPAVLAACAAGPDYRRPDVATPPAFKEAGPPAGGAGAPAPDLPDPWWTIFGDRRLDELEARIDVSNQSLKAAQARFRAARALVQNVRADELPSVTGGLSVSRDKSSRNRPLATPTAGPYTDLLVPVDMSYEVDAWGRVRRSVEASRASAEASAADVAAIRLSLQAELAMDYLEVRSLDAEAQLLDRTVESYQDALQLTEVRYHGGIAPEVDVSQARAQLESTRTAAVDLRVQRAQLEHAIAQLTGTPPASFSLPVDPSRGRLPPVPAGLPAQVLERRPDIAVAERTVAAASAQIGVAAAARFPTIELTASGGVESAALHTLLSPASTLWSLAAGVTQALFDGGRRKAASAEAVASYDAAVAGYRQAALTALQEVEDGLVALQILAAESRTQSAAVSAAQRSLALSQARYQGGVTTYLEVLTAQSTALANERSAVQIDARRAAASVLLVKAIGGGWRS